MFLFVIYMAEIAYVASTFENPLYQEEMGIFDFLKQPDVTLMQALLLKFKPVNMDVLPLYIVLLLGFPPILWLLQKQNTLALAASAALYAGAWHFGWNLPQYPSGTWWFNPFAWQLLFVLGAWFALGGADRIGRFIRSPIVTALAIAYLIFAFAITMTWHFPVLAGFVPTALAELIYPIDKVNLDVLRIAHFLALAAVTVRFIPSDWPGLESRWLRPAILCGQHSLEVFCLGIFLSFAGHFVFNEVSDRVYMHVLVSALGIAIMFAAAALISWYKRIEGRSPGSRSKPPLAGGEA
jgi:hypothetical protein